MVQITLSWWDLLLLGIKLAQFRLQQYRLTTKIFSFVKTKYGQVKGVKRLTIYDDSYYCFEGIPFAKPPLGELRFRAPQPPEPWNGVRDCTSSFREPKQKNFLLGRVHGSEDCLYLNVYAKTLKSDKPLPVMVWIYGGGFQIGAATRDGYAPDYFMKRDVVLVTVNYRVGALGFLSLNDPDLQVPGNTGLKDQLLALRWVKSNIANFNGDPQNITLFGQSAGAASTHMLMLSHKTKGLFHKAILQSASAVCHWAQPPPRKWGYRLAQKIGYNGSDNDKEVFRFLSQVESKKLVDTELLQTKEEQLDRILFPFAPVVEPYESEDAVITKPFVQLMAETWTNEIPIILGGTSFEGIFGCFMTHQNPDLLNKLGNCESILPLEIRPKHTQCELKEKALMLKRAYFGDEQPSYPETFMQYLDMLSYKDFWHGIHRLVLARKTYACSVPTYLYRFDYDSPHLNHFRIFTCGKDMRGVSHGDDMSYFFYNAYTGILSKESGEYKTIERIIKLWTQFAAKSDPNGTQKLWEPLNSGENEDRCLNINDELKMIKLPEGEKLKLWDCLYEKEALF